MKDWKLLLALGVILCLDLVCLTVTTAVERWRLSAIIVDSVSGGWGGEGKSVGGEGRSVGGQCACGGDRRMCDVGKERSA